MAASTLSPVAVPTGPSSFITRLIASGETSADLAMS
jgi:hypothetical protein